MTATELRLFDEGAPVAPPVVDAKAVDCPHCGAKAGRDCKRPSGHRAMYGEPHRGRVRAAEAAR